MNQLALELDINSAVDNIRDVVLELLNCERVTLFLVDSGQKELRCALTLKLLHHVTSFLLYLHPIPTFYALLCDIWVFLFVIASVPSSPTQSLFLHGIWTAYDQCKARKTGCAAPRLLLIKIQDIPKSTAAHKALMTVHLRRPEAFQYKRSQLPLQGQSGKP